MAKDGFKVMDSDMHVIEPGDLWQRYIDAPFRDRAPRASLFSRSGGQTLELEGKSYPGPYPNPRSVAADKRVVQEVLPRFQEEQARGFDSVAQVRAMDKEGIDVAILFPTRGNLALAKDGLDPEFAAAISRAYNDWLHDFCKEAPDRLYGVALIPPHNIEAACMEARRCVEELGFKGVFLRPNRVNGRNWYDPYYDPLWAELERLDVPIGFHEGGRSVDLPQVGTEFDTYLMRHTCTHSMALMLTVVSFVGGGVLARFPGLRVSLLEGNCSWAPWLLHRLDSHYEFKGKYEHPELRLKPSEYFRRQCFVAADCDEEPTKYVVDWGFQDNVVFSTDYPHTDSKYPRAVELFLTLPLPDEAKRKILWDNCARLYGLDK